MKLDQDDRIILKGLAFYGYHGVMPEEGKVGCRFSLDVECGLDLCRAAKSDDVEDTISYEFIFNIVREAFDEKRFKLLEALALHIIERLFASYKEIDWVRIRVAKPEAPIPVVTGEFAVQLTRERKKTGSDL